MATGLTVMEKSWNFRSLSDVMENDNLAGKLAICTKIDVYKFIGIVYSKVFSLVLLGILLPLTLTVAKKLQELNRWL